jgi:hypothetical protein
MATSRSEPLTASCLLVIESSLFLLAAARHVATE